MELVSRHLFTSESVTEGHPDKMADQISDAVLDAVLAEDPTGRVACESLLTTGLVVVAGELTTSCYVDFQKVVRETIEQVGYTDAAFGFDCTTCGVVTAINRQSPDIAMGVDRGGAGDQGMMFGFACNETEELMPLPIMLAHKLTQALAHTRKNGTLWWLRPDGKSQVTIEYQGNRPLRVDAVVISTQHDKEAQERQIRSEIIDHVIRPTIPEHLMDASTKFFVNPTGRFVTGGPMGDTGVTGRKIIVDTYGGSAAHGGGAFSGKDPSKVDRSAAYMMRYIAKNLVAGGLVDRVQLQVAYAIGVADPVSIEVNSFGTNKLDEERIADLIRSHFDLTPKGIIESLQLRRPIYRKTAAYGHFGRSEPEFTWERTDRAEQLRKDAGL
ncbi:MAG TPA: methionine adenosyltransferase [Acidobacteriota bacterium]